MEGSSPRRAQAARLGRMRAVDALTLAAVALVVLLVSLPRLRDLALRENESDAVWLAGRLAELVTHEVAADDPGAQDPQVPSLAPSRAIAPLQVEALLKAAPPVGRQVDDAEFLQGGRLLRRHGYLFEVVGVDGPGESEPGAPPAVRAWPWEAGRTGRVALLWTAASGLVGHPNPDGRWSGEHPPSPRLAGEDGWRHVRAR